MVAAEGEIALHLPFQHHLHILQGLVVQQPVQFSPLRWGVAVLVLHGDAVDGATMVPSSNRASTRLVSILKRQESSLFMVNLISISNGVCSDVLNPAIKPVVDLSIGLCFARLHIFAHFLHT